MSAVNSWRVMWVLVAFDTPVRTEQQRRSYTRFRKKLMELNFTMFQYSVYLRHCATVESATALTERVRNIVPASGHVVCFYLTDKQYGMTKEYFGNSRTEKKPQKTVQIELF